MKGKNISSQAVTKADLRKALKGIATKEDLKRFTTKEELKIEIKLSAEETTKKLREEIKLSADETVAKLEETIVGVKDILLATMDSFAKEIEANREDRDLAVEQTSKLQERVDNHERRIAPLEKARRVT